MFGFVKFCLNLFKFVWLCSSYAAMHKFCACFWHFKFFLINDLLGFPLNEHLCLRSWPYNDRVLRFAEFFWFQVSVQMLFSGWHFICVLAWVWYVACRIVLVSLSDISWHSDHLYMGDTRTRWVVDHKHSGHKLRCDNCFTSICRLHFSGQNREGKQDHWDHRDQENS